LNWGFDNQNVFESFYMPKESPKFEILSSASTMFTILFEFSHTEAGTGINQEDYVSQ